MLDFGEVMRQGGIECGLEQGRQDGVVALVHTLKNLLSDPDAIYQAVIQNEIYKNLTKEEVLRYYE